MSVSANKNENDPSNSPTPNDNVSTMLSSVEDIRKSLNNHVGELNAHTQKLEKKLTQIASELAEKERQLNLAWKQLNEEKQRINTIIDTNSVKLNIGGKIFETSIDTLTKDKGSMLAVMFSGRFTLKTDAQGAQFIDRDWKHFRHILNYLRDGHLSLSLEDEDIARELLNEAQFYQIAGLIDLITKRLNKNTEVVEKYSAQYQLNFSKLNDTNGVFYFIATKGGKEPWVNPHTTQRIIALASSHCPSLNPNNKLEDVLNCVPGISFGTNDEPNSWIQIDLGSNYLVTPNYYRFANTRRGNCHPRTWEFQGSKDGQTWVVLRRHENDGSLTDTSQVYGWQVSEKQPGAYRYVRIFQIGRSASGGWGHLCCAGLEVYGTLYVLKDK